MQSQGYELDRLGRVSKIKSTYAAAQWFKKNFVDNNMDSEKIRKVDFSDRVQSDFIKQYNDGTTEDVTKSTISWVVKVDFINHFGSMDSRYYYVVFRTRLFKRWANTYYESLKKFFNHDGITLNIDLPKHAYDAKRVEMSTFVIVTEDTSIYYMPMKKLINDCYNKWGTVTDKYQQVVIGMPISYFSKDEDVNKYD